MGDRGDFEDPDLRYLDPYRGGQYRPELRREGLPTTTLDEFKAEPPMVRAMIYATLAFAVMDDVSSLSQDDLLLLGYGLNVDAAGIFSTGETSSNLQEAFDADPAFERAFDDVRQFLYEGATGGPGGLDPNTGQPKPVDAEHQQIRNAYDIVDSWNAAPPERLFNIATLTAFNIIAFKGAVAGVVYGPVITTSLPLLHGGGSAAATKAAVVAGAMRITGNSSRIAKIASGGATLGRSAFGAGIGGSLVSATVGGTNQLLSALSNWFAGEEHQTQEDIQRGLADAVLIRAQDTQPQQGPTPGSPAAQGIQASAAAPTFFVQNPTGIGNPVGPIPPGSPLDPDALALIPGFAEAEYRDDPSIRVPFGFPQRQNLSELPDPDTGLLPSYTRNDITDALSNLSVGNVLRLQELAVRAGILDRPEGGLPNFLPGSRDEQTQIALATFMGQANIDFDQSWWMTATRMARLGDEARAKADAEKEAFRPRYVKEPFFKLDPASIRQSVDFQMERELGRPVNDWEWTTFLNGWQQDDRQRYEQEQAGNASLFEARYREGETHTAQSAGTFQTIDPQARFDEQFQTMFKGELNRKKRTEQVQNMTGNLMRSLSTAEAAVSR